MVAGLMDSEPTLGADVLFGAAAGLMIEKHFAETLLNSWSTGRSSLLVPGMDVSGRVPDHRRRAPDDWLVASGVVASCGERELAVMGVAWLPLPCSPPQVWASDAA